jgi:hypothetical protein
MKKIAVATALLIAVMLSISAGYAIFLDNQRVYPTVVRTIGLPSTNYGLYTSYFDGTEVSIINFTEPVYAGTYYEMTYFLRRKGNFHAFYNVSWYVDFLPSYLQSSAFWGGAPWDQECNRRWNVSEVIPLTFRMYATVGCASQENNFAIVMTVSP